MHDAARGQSRQEPVCPARRPSPRRLPRSPIPSQSATTPPPRPAAPRSSAPPTTSTSATCCRSRSTCAAVATPIPNGGVCTDGVTTGTSPSLTRSVIDWTIAGPLNPQATSSVSYVVNLPSNLAPLGGPHEHRRHPRLRPAHQHRRPPTSLWVPPTATTVDPSAVPNNSRAGPRHRDRVAHERHHHQAAAVERHRDRQPVPTPTPLNTTETGDDR